MEDLLAQVERYALRYGLLARGEVVVVGVSGGPDSLCLLHLLRRLAPGHDLRLHVAHLDHGLRGAASEADAAAVSALAAEWQLPCTLGRADVRALMVREKLSLETAARLARYRFLAETAEQAGASCVAVGHHAGDQAETVLMHLLRGSGLAGLRGMLPNTHLDVAALDPRCDDNAPGDLSRAPSPGKLRLVRPLLDVTRGAILAYCAAQGLKPRVDESNVDLAYIRNRLRHQLLPALESFNPAIQATLARTAAILAGDYEVLEEQASAAWQRIYLPGPALAHEVRLSLAGWRALPLALQRACLRRAISSVRGRLDDAAWEYVERALWLGRTGHTGQQATLYGGLVFQVGYDSLRLGAGDGLPDGGEYPQLQGPLVLASPGVTDLPGGWQVEVAQLSGAEGALAQANLDPWTAYVDAGVLGAQLGLRSRQPGERFMPLGLAGRSVSLHEFMIDRKVPRAARGSWPLLIGQAGLAWVCGLRLDQRAAVRPDTQAIWSVRFTRRADEKGERHG